MLVISEQTVGPGICFFLTTAAYACACTCTSCSNMTVLLYCTVTNSNSVVVRASTVRPCLSPIYTMKKSLRHATAMADLYYFVASPVENTHDKLANAQLATWVSHVAMHVASHLTMHAVAKVEPGSTLSRCDSLRQPATGVSPVAKLVATHVAAIFHSINRALSDNVSLLFAGLTRLLD